MTGYIKKALYLSLSTALLMSSILGSKAIAQSRTVIQYADFARYYYVAPKAFDYFDEESTGENTMNAYLLSQLADRIYMDAVTLGSFEQQLKEEFEPMGLEVVHPFMNWWTGTEGAVLANDNAVFIVFRGTSTNGTLDPVADYLGDIDDDFKGVTIDSKSFWVHKAFWNNVDSVMDEIRQAVLPHYLEGKKIWICGHSLGGANATLAGLRLHYQFDIDVQGVHTFGAPKVGDAGMKAKFYDLNKNGLNLVNRVQRWVMHNDPAHTFWEKELVLGKYGIPRWHYYEHVGVVNQIYAQSDGSFSFYLNTSSTSFVYNSLIDGLHHEHGWYDEALKFKLEDEGFNYVSGF